MVQGRDRDEPVSFPANTWYDAYQLLPSSSLFNSWEKRERKEGPQTISLTDIPSIPISWGRRRTLKFRITVESAPWCDCKNAKHTAYATRTLSAVGLFEDSFLLASDFEEQMLSPNLSVSLGLVMSFVVGDEGPFGIPRIEEPFPDPPSPTFLPPPPGFGPRFFP